jgi:polysaccharide biosynthesis protein VpsM
MTNKNVKIAVAIAFLGGALAAQAQTSPVRPAYQYPGVAPSSGAAAIQLGDSALYLTPYIGAAVGHDDNLFFSSANKKGSTLYVASPGLKVDARSANGVFQFSHQHQFGRFISSRDDDYVDHQTRAQYDMAFSGRAFMRLGFDHIHGHDPRGSTDRSFSPRPDVYEINSPNATFAFGAPGAQGRVEAYYAQGRKRYLNNRDTTFLGDRTTPEYGAAFYWRVMPKTYLLAEARETDIKYSSPLSPFSGTERRYYGGVTWEATAATVGTLKVGQLKKTFDSGRPSFSGTGWEGLVTWSPRTYSSFDFYTARTTNESTGLGNFIVSDIYGATWNHSWNSLVTTGLFGRHQKDRYKGFERDDKTTSLGLRAGYKFRRWLTLGAEYTHTKRDSNLDIFHYDRNLYLVTATASM